MKHILFFALREDLLSILQTVEGDGPIKYVRAGRSSVPQLAIFRSSIEIPDLGIATYDSSVGCESYLISRESAAVISRPVTELTGNVSYHVDQLLNPDSVTITAGGTWSTDVILHGRVATASDTSGAQELMKLFGSAFRKHSRKVGAYRVGPCALARLEAGVRLTAAVQSPPEYDLQYVAT